MALRLCPSSGQFLLLGTVETDTCNGPRAGRLSSEHPPFGPKTLPISSPWGASCTGAARYLLLFVWSNPTQFKPRLTARTFKPALWHLRGLDTESRTQLLLWNVIWLIDFGVASLECLGEKKHRDGLWWKPLGGCFLFIHTGGEINLLLLELSPFRYKMLRNTKCTHLSSDH